MSTDSVPPAPDVRGWHAAVSSDHPLASAAGAEVLRGGGNAIDAAVTMAAVVAVTRPHMNGVGGDGFLLYREAATGQLFVLNGSGAAGAGATPAFFAGLGLGEIPATGVLSVSVPGIVRMWQDALERFGTISLARALEPAIGYADAGFVVSDRLHADIAEGLPMVIGDPEMTRTFLDHGEPPKVGTVLRQSDLATTLRAIAAEGADAVYTGGIAAQIIAFIEREGGLLTANDLARHTSRWQQPIETTYLGRRVLACPPNTQGMALLEQLNIAEHFDLQAMGHNSASYVHTLVEGCKRAFADRDAQLADPDFFNVPVELLTSKEHARDLMGTIHELGSSKSPSTANRRPGGLGDTIYLCVVDEAGNAVSWIQSIFGVFGSGRMVPGTGILLHNRGSQFSLDHAHPNCVAPGKRPYHTLSAAMVLNGDRSLAMVLGTPGADGQTQTVTQLLNNLLLFGMTPQHAVDAPRWRSYGARLAIESGVPTAVVDTLRAGGHAVSVLEPSAEFGGAQMITVLPSGEKVVGSDYRREACGIAW